MKMTKQQRQLRASNAAHLRLLKRANRVDDEDKYHYHRICFGRQENFGRVLTRTERKEIFDYVTKRLWL